MNRISEKELVEKSKLNLCDWGCMWIGFKNEKNWDFINSLWEKV